MGYTTEELFKYVELMMICVTMWKLLTRKAVAMVADLLIPAQQLTRTLVSGPSDIAALIQSPVSWRIKQV